MIDRVVIDAAFGLFAPVFEELSDRGEQRHHVQRAQRPRNRQGGTLIRGRGRSDDGEMNHRGCELLSPDTAALIGADGIGDEAATASQYAQGLHAQQRRRDESHVQRIEIRPLRVHGGAKAPVMLEVDLPVCTDLEAGYRSNEDVRAPVIALAPRLKL